MILPVLSSAQKTYQLLFSSDGKMLHPEPGFVLTITQVPEPTPLEPIGDRGKPNRPPHNT